MIPISPALKSLYTNGGTFQFNAKLQVLDKNYNVLYDTINETNNPITDGQVTCDKSRKAFRSFDLKLVNTSGKFTWGSSNLIWLDKKFRLFIGVWVNSAWEWIPAGVYPCSAPMATSEPGKNMVEFQGPDKMNFLSKTSDNITVSKGTDIATAIKSVLSGIETMFNLDSTSGMQTVPYDMTWPMNTDYSKIIADLAAIIVWDIFYDANGFLRLRAPIDPNTTAPQLTLSSQATAFNLWAGAQRQLDDANLANYIVVVGGSTQTALVNSVKQDNNPSSPTSIQNIGKRVYLHNNGSPDPVIVTQALADARALYEYKKRLQIVEKLNFKMFPSPFMEHDDVYQITDSANGTSGKYQVVSYSLPIGGNGSLQSGYLWQVRQFG